MRLPHLIVRTARAVLTTDPALLGVRLSPIALKASQAEELATIAVKELGSSAYVIVSAPGVGTMTSETSRVCMAPDHRAAEQATAWRNVVNVKRGEHLLYVSAEEHDKAGGLRDCLIELTDEDLVRELQSYCREQGGAIQQAAEALEEARLLDRMSPAMLAEFLEITGRVANNKKDKDAWVAIGEHLPLLGLARDTKLSRANAGERLSENRRLVTRVATGEVRRQGSGQLAEIEKQLREGLRHGERTALASVDLGSAKLTKPAPKRRDKAPLRVEKPAPKKVGRGARERSGDEEDAVPDGAAVGKGASPRNPGSAAASGGARWPAVQGLSSALRELFAELNKLQGAPVECRVRSVGRRWLQELPSSSAITSRTIDWPTKLAPLHRELVARREALLARIDPDPDGATRVLVGLPAAVLKVPEIDAAAAAYIAACADFLFACDDQPDEVMRAALERDSIALLDDRGPGLRLLGPLHPLWFAQAHEMARALSATTSRDESDLLRRMLHTHVSPPSWPLVDGNELLAAAAEFGLTVFERNPGATEAKVLEHASQRLGRRFLELCPHARIGLNVAVVDGDPSSVVEGLARAALDLGDQVKLRITCDRPIELGTTAEQLVASARLSVTAVPHPVWDARPHLIFRLAPQAQFPEEDEPGLVAGATAASGGVLKTDFVLDASGLRACVNVSGVPALRAFDRVHAILRRRRPTGVFTHDLRVTALSTALPTSGASAAVWHVAIGPGLGRRLPMDFKLLIYEPIDRSTVVAAVSKEVRPASRAVAEGLVRTGLTEDNESFRTISALTGRLATGSGAGILSLEHGSERLIASGLLGLELQRRGAAVVARPEGAQYERLMGELPSADVAGALAFALAATQDDELNLTVGYATLDADADLRRHRNSLTGVIADRIRRVLTIVRLAGSDGAVGLAALEILSWILFPAIASNMEADRGLAEKVARWSRGDAPVLSALILVPPALAAASSKSLELDRVPVSIVALNTDLFNRLMLVG